jgi:hypothetical protein
MLPAGEFVEADLKSGGFHFKDTVCFKSSFCRGMPKQLIAEAKAAML